MRRFVFACILSLAAVLFLSVPQLRADSFDSFSWVESGGGTTVELDWQMPVNPVAPPDFVPGSGFTGTFTADTTVYLDGILLGDGPDLFNFLDGSIGGGFEDAIFGFSIAGFQAFSGPDCNINFNPGLYTGIDNTFGFPGTLTVTPVNTPEPSSVLMLFIGFLAIAAVFSVRKLQA